MPTITERGKNTDKVREIASSFFHKIADSLGPQKDDKPPLTPPRPSQSSNWKPSQSHTPQDNLVSSFNDLSISNGTSHAPTSPFVGGFNPTFPGVQGSPYAATSPSQHANAVSTPNFTSTVMMPVPHSDYPQSLTMQMALRPETGSPITRPHSTPFPSGDASSNPPSISSRPPARPSASGRKASESDASSTSSTSSQKSGQQQCAATTKKSNTRCTRMVKVKPYAYVSDDGDEVERFCYQHQKDVLAPTGCHRPHGDAIVFVEFKDWIPSYLQPDTQASLRAEMDRARTKSDGPGYIYTFEIKEDNNKETIKLKVGRTVNLAKRMDQWGKQCGSKEQFLRGFYPGTVDEDGQPVIGSLMKGRTKAGEKTPYCHRLERLIHIELTDLVSSSIYLDPSWPNIEIESPSTTGDSKSSSKKTKNASPPCPDCGTMHKEIFEFTRWRKGPNRGKEWEKLVKPVVERWGKYVELYV
ncbi:hypothetical protein JR316_0003685 [Psilocybe cubensis]|uniref:Uncharacterized protein n=2 Tax=Psilocybe cubensis TaxID=181762 RepID=A0ACB8HAM8_PSICU|nr:hypothetical protein JR316_0003685 [Psilocybe cubensis]KAH9484205.1 hypothetical protein JR316_0003685 [Psilocybe cubensis]